VALYSTVSCDFPFHWYWCIQYTSIGQCGWHNQFFYHETRCTSSRAILKEIWTKRHDLILLSRCLPVASIGTYPGPCHVRAMTET